jgi:hypothetical protein
VQERRTSVACWATLSELDPSFYLQGKVRIVDATPEPDNVYALGVRPLFLPSAVFLLGPPGSGRATQAARVAAEFPRFAHISVRALVKSEVARRTPIGLAVDAADGALPSLGVLLGLVQVRARGCMGRHWERLRHCLLPHHRQPSLHLSLLPHHRQPSLHLSRRRPLRGPVTHTTAARTS